MATRCVALPVLVRQASSSQVRVTDEDAGLEVICPRSQRVHVASQIPRAWWLQRCSWSCPGGSDRGGQEGNLRSLSQQEAQARP